MEKWARDNGAELNNCVITDIEEFDYGLQATGFIEKGSVILSVPKKMMITVECMNGSPMGKNLTREQNEDASNNLKRPF